MASLHDVIAFILECAAHGSGTGDGGFTDDFCRQIERQVQGRFPGERVYVAPSGRRTSHVAPPPATASPPASSFTSCGCSGFIRKSPSFQ